MSLFTNQRKIGLKKIIKKLVLKWNKKWPPPVFEPKPVHVCLHPPKMLTHHCLWLGKSLLIMAGILIFLSVVISTNRNPFVFNFFNYSDFIVTLFFGTQTYYFLIDHFRNYGFYAIISNMYILRNTSKSVNWLNSTILQ